MNHLSYGFYAVNKNADEMEQDVKPIMQQNPHQQ